MTAPPALELTVDGRPVQLAAGGSVLDAVHAAGAAVPTLCFGETLTPVSACRACVVELEGSRTLIPACSREAAPGMAILTDSARVRTVRRMVLELLASASDLSLTEALSWVQETGADPDRLGPFAGPSPRQVPEPGSHHAPDPAGAATVAEPVKVEDGLYVRDYAKCILCYRCVEACGDDHQHTFAIAVAGRGFDARISTEFDAALPDSACVYCGNCISVCPTGALMGRIQFDLRAAGEWAPERQTVTRTICPYCGVGCNLDLIVQDGRIVEADAPFDHDVTIGNLCIKGRFGWQHLYDDLDA